MNSDAAVTWNYHLCLAFLASLLLSTPVVAAEVEALSDRLASYGLAAGEAEAVATDRVAGWLSGKALRGQREVVPGVKAWTFASDEETLVVLAARADTRGVYTLPGGPTLAFVTAAGVSVPRGAVLDEPVLFAVSDRGWAWVKERVTLLPVKSVEAEVTGAAVDELAVEVTLFVSPGGDGDGASEAAALPSLGAGVERAVPHLQNGRGVRIALAPGVYRDGEIELHCGGWSDAARSAVLVIEGVGDRPAVVTGADDWTGGWQPVPDAPGVYIRDWPHRFGMGHQPWETWGFLLDPQVARAEVVSVAGELLLPVMLERFTWTDPDGPARREESGIGDNVPGQWAALGVASPATLTPGTFGVVEGDDNTPGRLYVCPPDGTDPNRDAVEVAVRRGLLGIHDRENLVLRNLTFKHAASQIGTRTGDGRSAVELRGRNVLLDRVTVEENGARGLSLGESTSDLTLRRCGFNGNGWQGLGLGYRFDNVLMEGCESSYNNWRGHMGNQHSWDAAAVKAFGLDPQIGLAIRGHRSFANLTHGLWLDQSFTPRSVVEISDCLIVGNIFGAGLYLEKLTGPVDLKRNVVWNDRGIRAVDGTSLKLRFEDNLLYTQPDGDPVFFLHRRGDESEYANTSKDWTVRRNLIVSHAGPGTAYQQHCSDEKYDEFLDTLDADGNVYWSPETDRLFDQPGGEPIGFAAWQSRIVGDQASRWADPEFADADGYDWRVTNPDVRAALPDLPGLLSAEDHDKLEHATRQAQRFLAIAAARGHTSGDPFPQAANAVDNAWAFADLTTHLNRRLTGDDAWIGSGNQLPQLQPGRHVFAGVRFDVAAPGAVALRSNRIHATSDGQPLPTEVELSIDATLPALYVLHGAGWIGEEYEPAARYELVYADGTTHAVDVAPQQLGAPDGAPAPRVGEWHHSFPVFDTKDTRHVALRGTGGDPGATLYALEIVNPHADRKVEALRLRSVGVGDTSVLVLAVSWLTY